MSKELTAGKAREILHDNSAQGHPLTAKQKRFFGWVAGGKKHKKKTHMTGRHLHKG